MKDKKVTEKLRNQSEPLLRVFQNFCEKSNLVWGGAINKGKFFGKKYTRIMIQSFVFIIFTDIFFAIISIFQGGIFKGWLAKKRPD